METSFEHHCVCTEAFTDAIIFELSANLLLQKH